MMSSVDMSLAGRGSHPSSQQFSGSGGRQNVRYGAPPPRSSGSSTGRAKTEQVVLEFLYKAAELIVQSRVNFQAEPDVRRGSRRARFNLDIEEVQVVRDAMAAWKEDVRLPLAIDIFWDGDGQKVLLERWSVTFAAEGEASNAHLGSTQDVIQQLKEVCKRISVLLRALFSFMRQLPAHRLFAQSYPSMLSYTMHAAPATDAARAFEAQRVATSAYSFIPIAAPFGFLKVAAVYRRDCDQFTERQEQAAPSRIFQDNFIIQDYVPGSPELVPASAPVQSSTMADSPMRVTDLRTDSFVPVSDAEQFGGDVAIPQRRRSTPRSIPISTPQHQQFSSTGPVGDNRADDPEVTVRTQPGMSKPMAIPRVSSKGGIVAGGGRDAAANAGYDEQNDAKHIQHAHSYGGEHDARLRGAAANPNVTAAPYGYGNVAIEREQQHASSPSLAFQQRQQQLWEGSASRQDTENALLASQSSLHDEPLTSNSNAAYHRLSTPPRHPKTMSLLRNSRTSPALPHKPFLTGNESHPAPGSLDNFTLDSGSPSPLQQYVPRRRKSSFNGAFVSSDSGESNSMNAQNTVLTEAEGIQGDACSQAATAAVNTTAQTEAITIRPCLAQQSPSDGMPMFSSSPPFQANPCELLSTSPGYSYSKNYLRSGSSNAPTFITTDQFQHGLQGAKRSSFSSSAGLISAKARGFSPDFSDSGVTAWGISPDTPDAFGLALVGMGGSSSGGRPRFLSLSGSADNGSDDHEDGLADSDDMILPFAIGGGSAIGSSATTAADSASTGAGSTLNHSVGASSDSASVGNFLHQLKNAPRLAISTPTLADAATEGSSKVSDEAKQDTQVPTSMFDDELAGFRSLRDELAQVL